MSELKIQVPHKSPKLPDFLILGAAKAGTTALFKAIGRHPQVFSPALKEPRFFAYAGNPPMFSGPAGPSSPPPPVTEESTYLELFKDCPLESKAFEGSTVYLSDEGAPETVAKYVPQCRLIAILRHPVERAYSHFLHARSLGLEPLRNFEEAWYQSIVRKTENWSPMFHYRDRGFYGAQLLRWLKHFPQEQMLVLFYEDWLSDPGEVLARIWRHAGLGAPERTIVTRENVSSRQPRWLWLQSQMLNQEHPLRRLARQALPLWVRDAVTSSVATINLANGPTLDPAVRRSLAKTYHDDLDLVEEMTGRNLDAWRT
jgi:hypothetical protein